MREPLEVIKKRLAERVAKQKERVSSPEYKSHMAKLDADVKKSATAHAKWSESHSKKLANNKNKRAKLVKYAEKMSNKTDPHWRMADRPEKTKGHQTYKSLTA